MIFVTVGNATQGFSRFLNAVDRMAGEGVFGKEIVFIQSGNNPDFRSSHCKHELFLNMENFETKIQEADLVISHAGAGTLFHVFQAGKLPVVMPRRKKYEEHVDDHQIELVRALVDAGRVIAAYEPSDLPGAIKEGLRINGVRGKEGLGDKGVGIKGAHSPYSIIPNPMLKLVAKAIEELTGAVRSQE